FESEHNFDDDDGDGDESEEEEFSNRLMTNESTEAQDEPDNADDTNIQNIQQYYHLLALINSTLEKYQRDGEIFGSIVEYNGQTLLDIHDAGDCGRFARTVLKNLFTPAEMSRSVLYSNSVYAKPSLDPIRTK
ncbi:unnamed protein product, partial [Rotaria sp. Silwood2]